MSIDWSGTGAMLSGIGSVGGALATAAGAGAVVWAAKKAAETVESWRQQKVVQRKFEHAERTVAAAHNAAEALKYVRGALMLNHELTVARSKLEKSEGWGLLPEQKQKRLDTTQAIYERLNNTQAERDELRSCIALDRALFGQDLEKAVSDLHQQFWIARTWADAYAEDWNGLDADFSIKIRRELWSNDVEQSEVARVISDSLAKIYEICLPILQA